MGGHLLSGKNSGYMKKELHRHHEDAGTALNFCIKEDKQTITPT